MLLAIGGCRDETPVERAAREAKQAADEQARLRQASDAAPVKIAAPRALPAPAKGGALALKPGHWTVVQQLVAAPSADLDGEVTLRIVDRRGQSAPVPQTRYAINASRPAVLSTGSAKELDLPLLALSAAGSDPGGAQQRLNATVRTRGGAALVQKESGVAAMADHQSTIVVLARDPTPYGFLPSLHAVDPGLPDTLDAGRLGAIDAQASYRVVGVPAGTGVAGVGVPDTPFAWTSIACVVWDEADPDALRPAQRDAIVDWLNWGGTLVVSGPGSLDTLRGSFLAPLLPATSRGVKKWEAVDLAAMRREWTASRKPANDRFAKGLASISGVELAPTSDATSAPGLAGIVVERRIGRGRLVVTALRLSEPSLVNWRAGFENFFNGALLRRPGRRFDAPGSIDLLPAGDQGDAVGRSVASWRDPRRPRFDPSANTALRYFSRDALASPSRRTATEVSEEQGFARAEPPVERGGCAAWNDDSPVATAARGVLRDSAGVTTPGASFVLICLAAYVLAVGPLNWLVFYAAGRTEWAWIAAPIIAVATGLAVTRQAQLDIGFVRSQVEVAILETQPHTPRGVLSRFTALYSSLGTDHDFEFASGSAVAAPFAARAASDAPAAAATRPLSIQLERQERVRLKGLFIPSASTELVRSDETVDVAALAPEGSSDTGRVVLGRSIDGALRVENHTRWRLTSVTVVERPAEATDDPRLTGCWVGDLGPGAVAAVAFLPIEVSPLPTGGVSAFRRERREAAESIHDNKPPGLDLAPLEAIALDPSDFEPGERRVVARLDESLAGLDVKPRPSQRRGATLLVCHLSYPNAPAPQKDANTPFD
jgi:hypothetical protein